MGVVCACHPSLRQTEPKDPGASRWLDKPRQQAQYSGRVSMYEVERDSEQYQTLPFAHVKCEYPLMHMHTHINTIDTSVNSKLFSL